MNSLKYRMRLARELSFTDWLTLGEAWLRLFYFSLTLRRTSYQNLMDAAPRFSRGMDSSREYESAQRIQRMIRYAARFHIPAMTCLPQSLTLRWMLLSRGIPAQIRIGVQKQMNTIHAHAWVEVSEKAVGEPGNLIETFNALSTG